MAGFMDSGVSTNIATTTAGLILNSHTAPAATNAYVNYDGTNVGFNSPGGKGFNFTVGGSQIGFISPGGTIAASNVSPGLSSNSWNVLMGLDSAAGGSSGVTININSTGGNKVSGVATDGATAVALAWNSRNTLSTPGAKLLSVQNNGVEKSAIDLTGAYTPTSASSGVGSNPFFGYNGTNVLINAPSAKAILGMINGTTFPFRGVAVAANDTTLDGQFEVSHLSGGSGAPTNVTLGTGCGAAQSGANNAGSDLGGTIGGTCGSAGTGGQPFVTITWAHAYNTAPFVTISPANSATAALSGATQVFPTPGTTTLAITAGATAPPAGTYLWYYKVNQ